MSKLNSALGLASMGFRVFPVVAGGKKPLVDEFARRATADPDEVRRLFKPFGDCNVGISCDSYGAGEALIVIDVDDKGEKRGSEELLKLELQGLELPPTLEQTTPTGGTHLIYRAPVAGKQGTNVLGPGLDIRSRGGYVVAAGSVIGGRPYTLRGTRVAEAPAWLVERVRDDRARTAPPSPPKALDLTAGRLSRGMQYLRDIAPLAVQGDAGDQTTFQVAATLKDYGFSAGEALALMAEMWNGRCSPPWAPAELKTKVDNAYRYGGSELGAAAPENEFEPIVPEQAEDQVLDTPIDKLNAEFAFVTVGGGHHILWETTDQNGRFTLEHLSEATFHAKFKAWQYVEGNRAQSWTKAWMSSPRRREYRGLCFKPGLETPAGWYNLWRGFAYKPSSFGSPRARAALNAFMEHALKNVCGGSEELCRWLLGYFAHMVQRPWEKPLVALVFKGEKGVGKNALIDRMGALLGSHYLLTAKQRYLVGNFNGHLENLILLTLDEAFWSGDKSIDGILKDLVTGKHHVIERKGKEPYQVENCLRVVIMGNENWLVKATEDERRFAVFDVGTGRKQDRQFFQEMREGMEDGGYELLLDYLLNFDLSKVDVNCAPATSGLMEQKLSSLEPFEQWWHQNLIDGEINGLEFGGHDWPVEIGKKPFLLALRTYVSEHNIRGRMLSDVALGRALHKVCPRVKSRRLGPGKGHVYDLPSLEVARQAWDLYIGHKADWPKENKGGDHGASVDDPASGLRVPQFG